MKIKKLVDIKSADLLSSTTPGKSPKFTYVLIGLVILLVIGGFFAYQKITAKKTDASLAVTQEIDLSFDPEGPYALLSPRRDGNALVLNIKRTASYDKISYELAYNSEGIDRGVMGDINMGEKKGEYEQEILFGTCSKNVCKYDANVSNGTLLLKIQKGNILYKMNTTWHLQKPEIALGYLTAGDEHMSYQIDKEVKDLSLLKFTMINDLSGAPKLPGDKAVVGKVYSLTSVSGSDLPKGTVTIELADTPASQAKIARFDETANKWVELETKITDSKLTAFAPTGGIFTVLTTKQ